MGAMRPASSEEALSYCLDNPDGLITEDLLSRFPEYSEELEPLLALDAGIRTAASEGMADDSRLAMRARLVSVAAAGHPAAAVLDGRGSEPESVGAGVA